MTYQLKIECTICGRLRNPQRYTSDYKIGDVMPYECKQCSGNTDHEVIDSYTVE